MSLVCIYSDTNYFGKYSIITSKPVYHCKSVGDIMGNVAFLKRIIDA